MEAQYIAQYEKVQRLYQAVCDGHANLVDELTAARQELRRLLAQLPPIADPDATRNAASRHLAAQERQEETRWRQMHPGETRSRAEVEARQREAAHYLYIRRR